MEMERGIIKVYLSDLIASMTIEQKREAAEMLLWDKEMFDEFVDNLTGTPTVTRSFNSYVYEARMRLLDQLPEMNQNIIRSLLREKNEAQAEEQRWRQWAWKLFHSWPAQAWQNRPQTPEWVASAWPTDEEIEAVANPKEQPE